jgi:hypothetical protein
VETAADEAKTVATNVDRGERKVEKHEDRKQKHQSTQTLALLPCPTEMSVPD